MTAPIILYDNVLTLATPTVTDTATGYDIRNICDYRSYTYWVGASAGQKDIVVNCGAAEAVNTIAVIGHNWVTAGITCEVHSSEDGAIWATKHSATLPTTDRAFMNTFSTNTSAQYWKIRLGAGSAAPQIGEVYLGTRLVFPKTPDSPVTPFVETVEAETVAGKTGHLLGATLRYRQLAFSPKWNYLSSTWVNGDFTTFWQNHGRLLRPFFWAWDLGNYSTHVFFVTMKDPATFQAPMRMTGYVTELTLPMVGVAEL